MSGSAVVMQEGFVDHLFVRSSLPENIPKDENETFQRFTGVGIGVVSLLCENLISHPFIISRRQCQVHRKSNRYHLTPFSLLPVMVRLHSRQGFGTLWKGAGSVFIVRGLTVATETAISEFTSLPKEVSWESSTKQFIQHLALKGCTYILLTPFLCASLIETVQSDIASEKPGVFEVLKEGVCRVFRWGTPQSPRLFPIWVLIAPTVVHYLLSYVLSSLVKSVSSWILTVNLQREREKVGIIKEEISVIDQHMCEISAAFVGNIMADIILYPSETVLHRLYLQGTRTIIDNLDSGMSVVPVISTYQGLFDCFNTIIQEEGAAGLYKGFGALVLQYTIHGIILKVTKLLVSEINHALRPRNKQ